MTELKIYKPEYKSPVPVKSKAAAATQLRNGTPIYAVSGDNSLRVWIEDTKFYLCQSFVKDAVVEWQRFRSIAAAVMYCEKWLAAQLEGKE